MYRELQQLDLYAKKLMRREHYHRNFTRGLTKSSLVNPRNEENGSGITGFFWHLARFFLFSVVTGMHTLLPKKHMF